MWSRYAPHTLHTPVEPPLYSHYISRCACTQLAEAVPIPGSGIKLPLDLNFIASRCTGAYFAPKRFSAIQLAFTHPRARVLVFHTGRLVGTGMLVAYSVFNSVLALTTLTTLPFAFSPGRYLGPDGRKAGHCSRAAADEHGGRRAPPNPQLQCKSDRVSNMHTPCPVKLQH